MILISSFRRVVLLSVVAACSAQAGTNGFIVPSFRGSANSQAGYWEIFSTAVGAPGNLPDKPGATTGARLTQNSPTAFLTGIGNIYNLDNPSLFSLTNTTAFTLGTIVLQTHTLGSELDYAGLRLQYNGTNLLAPVTSFELDRASVPGLGFGVSWLWQWNLSGLNATNYTINFNASAPSCSFDSLTLDTANVFTPVPPFGLSSAQPAIERWMYAFNAAPCDRTASSTFGTFGDDAGVDTRHGQHLVGWDTSVIIPTNLDARNYLLRRCRVTLTINRGNVVAYDPTHDDFRTYLDVNDPSALPDADAGRPMELFGVGFRNGFTVASFTNCSDFGTNSSGQRNAYAASYSTNGLLIDVSNNVGKTNAAYPHFEAIPFAVGQTTNASVGQLIPSGARITFDLNLSNHFVLGYIQQALNGGRLRFMVSSLHTNSGQLGGATYPDFATRFNEAVIDPTRFELEGSFVRNADSDGDGLADDWEQFYFHSLSAAALDDADQDGRNNLQEYRAGTEPLNANSALRLLSIKRSQTTPLLQFTPAASRPYVIEFTENLSTWSVGTNPVLRFPTPDVAEWSDSSATVSNRFYRVRTE